MSLDLSSQGRRNSHGRYTNRTASIKHPAFLTPTAVPHASVMPEVSHGLERVDRRERVDAIFSGLRVRQEARTNQAIRNLMVIDDTFLASLESLLYAVPFANEMDGSKKFLTDLIGSSDHSEIKRKLGSSSIMYGRKDHSQLLWLVNGLMRVLPERKRDASTADDFLVLDEDI